MIVSSANKAFIYRLSNLWTANTESGANYGIKELVCTNREVAMISFVDAVVALNNTEASIQKGTCTYHLH